jgi:P-type conjugative transfer protein TrbJ
MTRREVLGSLALGLTLRRLASPMTGMPFATEWTQLLNYATLARQYLQTAQMVQQQLQALRYQGIAGRLLTLSQFGQLANNLVTLGRNVQQGHALSYTLAHLDIAFRSAFPGYLNSNAAFDPQYRQWSQVSLDTIGGILGSIGQHNADLNSDARIMDFLSQKQGSVAGETQAIQAGTEVANFQASQLLKLRQLMSAQITQTGVALGRQIQVEQAKADVVQKAVKPAHYVATN